MLDAVKTVEHDHAFVEFQFVALEFSVVTFTCLLYTSDAADE